MDGFAFLVAVVTFIMALVALNKISSLETRLAQLKLQLGVAIDELAALRTGRAATPVPPVEQLAKDGEQSASEAATLLSEPTPMAVDAVAEPVLTEPAVHSQSTVDADLVAAPVAASPPPRRPPGRDMEQALASRWFVWIGGLAIAIGGVLFVKYAYDNHLIPPTLQIILGVIAGAALVVAGEFVRRMSGTGNTQGHVPAALSAGGIATLFGSIYAAYALYDLVAPATAFIGLAVIAVGALVLSRLQGPFIAALGLIGSYGTPAIIPSESPSAWGLFAYLLVILVASFGALRGRIWWWLGYAAIAGSSLWGLLWLNGPYQSFDTVPVAVFAIAIGLIALFGLLGRGILAPQSGSLRGTPPLTPQLMIGLAGLAAATAVLAVLVYKSGHAALAMAFFLATALLTIALGWRKQGLDLLAPLAAFLVLVVLNAWPEVAFHDFAMDENGVWSSIIGPAARDYLAWTLGSGAVLTAIGCLGARTQPSPVVWAGMGGAAAAAFVFGAWARVDVLFSPMVWALIAVGFAAVLLVTAAVGRNQQDADPQADLSAGVLSAGASLLLLFAADRWFDGVWLTLVIAAMALCFAVLAARMRITLQASIAAGLGSLTTLRLFVSRHLWFDDRTLPLGQHWVIYGYGVPAILFVVASRILKTAGYVRSAVSLEGLSLGLIISLASLEIRVLIGGGITADQPQLLEVAAHILTWLGAAYGLLYRQRIYSSFIVLWGARALLLGSAVAMIGGSLIALNPVVSGEPLQGGMVFNALLLAYIAPIALLALLTFKLDVLRWSAFRPVMGGLALALVFVYVTLETKRLFQGPLMVPWALTIAESYAYSAVWLLLALALFVAGLKLARQYIRYAGLGVMVLVVLKVFLWDMSNLEGLYRIVSFIGLGLCLVGIGWLYQRFVQPRKPVTP